jgi:S1-C subfamily serine protease
MNVLAQLSDAITAQVTAAAPLLCAVRTGPGRHTSGIVWRHDIVVTADHELPALQGYNVVLASGDTVVARVMNRHSISNLAFLQLDAAAARVDVPLPLPVSAGALVLVVGADSDASPLARLVLVRKFTASGRNDHDDPTIILDLPPEQVPSGAAILDAEGGLVGMAMVDPHGEAGVVPYATIARLIEPLAATPAGRRGWLGAALQPVVVPRTFGALVGQTSGRLVVSLSPSGPADLAGIRNGDILLTLDGHSMSGPRALRTYLGPDRVGQRVEVRFMRAGRVETAELTVAPHPGE